jgi:site-specific recombinase XerD
MLYTYPSISKFAQFVQLKDYRQPTKKEYVRYLLRFADHLQRDPATASEDDLRRYYLFLRQHKKFGPSAMKLAKCALRCFYREDLKLGLDWTVFEDLRIAPPQTLPLVLTRQEVAAVLGAVREPRLRSVLAFIYHTGTRLTLRNGPRKRQAPVNGAVLSVPDKSALTPPMNTHTQAQPNRRRHWRALNSVTRLTPGLPSPSSNSQRRR